MGLTSLDNPEQFPVKCCREEIHLEDIVSTMGTRNRKRYISRTEEQAVPADERIYCPRATCGQWIHPNSKGPRPGTRLCTQCRAKVCCACREFAHGPWPCADDESLKTVLGMAKDNKWQRCTKCHYMVEKVDGCNHILCRCGHHFWYVRTLLEWWVKLIVPAISVAGARIDTNVRRRIRLRNWMGMWMFALLSLRCSKWGYRMRLWRGR
ncbi:unnamed protein product [Penicillium salamii]|nr:unnamed protein product [Penicillium salamii]CAG8226660.1 unnamed protein product [Penicillium salamii]